MDVNSLITTLITGPLSRVTTGLPGFLLITSIANLFFGFGIHQAVISGSLLDPFLIQNMQENMAAYANREDIPHIINMAFKDTFAVMGGSGNTIALLITIFIFSRRKDYKDFAKLSVTPALFNICIGADFFPNSCIFCNSCWFNQSCCRADTLDHSSCHIWIFSNWWRLASISLANCDHCCECFYLLTIFTYR